jgi:hypothetical protein
MGIREDAHFLVYEFERGQHYPVPVGRKLPKRFP